MRSRKLLVLLVGLLVAGGFLIFAFWNVDFAELGAVLAGARKIAIVPFLAALFGFYWLKTCRWQLLLAPIKRVPARELFPALMVGYGVSMLVPMHLGEVARVLITRSEHDIRASALAMSIAFERLLDLLAIPFLFAVAMSAGRDLPIGIVRAGYAMGLIGLAGLAVVTLIVTCPRLSLRIIGTALRLLPPHWADAILAQLEVAVSGAQALRQPLRMGGIVFLTAAQWVLMWLCAWVSVWAVGIDTSWSASLLTVALINVAVALPTSPGYVGSVQAAFVLAMLPFGIAREAAIGASIFFHMLIYVAVVGTGLAFLHRAGRSLRSIMGARELQGEPLA